MSETKLEAALEAARALPPEEQDHIADVVMDYVTNRSGDSLLTPEQQAELARRLAKKNPRFIPHDEVMAKIGKRLASRK